MAPLEEHEIVSLFWWLRDTEHHQKYDRIRDEFRALSKPRPYNTRSHYTRQLDVLNHAAELIKEMMTEGDSDRALAHRMIARTLQFNLIDHVPFEDYKKVLWQCKWGYDAAEKYYLWWFIAEDRYKWNEPSTAAKPRLR